MTTTVDGVGVASVVALFVGRPRIMTGSSVEPVLDATVDDEGGSATSPSWASAIVKDRVDGPRHLGTINIDGDDQADRRVHGGPDKAVCAYPAAHYARWWSEVDWPDHLGPAAFGPGAFGENVSVSAPLTEDDVCIGDVFRLGDATVQISQPRSPCWKLGRRWAYPDLTARTRDTDRTGWYFRVLEPGMVAAGSAIELLERPFAEWTVTEANRVKIHDRHDLEAAERLGRCPALAAEWSVPLLQRVERNR